MKSLLLKIMPALIVPAFAVLLLLGILLQSIILVIAAIVVLIAGGISLLRSDEKLESKGNGDSGTKKLVGSPIVTLRSDQDAPKPSLFKPMTFTEFFRPEQHTTTACNPDRIKIRKNNKVLFLHEGSRAIGVVLTANAKKEKVVIDYGGTIVRRSFAEVAPF
jgi:hypothetical protein